MPSVILATAGYDHTIRFWEAPTGICYRTVQYSDSQVNCLKITPDKQFLAAAGNPSIRLFEINSNNPNPVTSYDGHTSNVTAVGFQKDGKWMYSCSEDGTIKIWDLRAQGCQRNYENGTAINSVVLHPNQVELISGDQNGVIKVWNLTKDSCTTELIPEGEVAIRSVAAANDGSIVTAGNNSGNVFVIDSSEKTPYKLMKTFQAHNGYLLKCEISPDDKYLATASSDKSVKLWNIEENFSPYRTLANQATSHSRWVWDCAFSADSSFLVTASSDQQAFLWDLSNGEVIRQYLGHHKAVVCVALNDTSVEL